MGIIMAFFTSCFMFLHHSRVQSEYMKKPQAPIKETCGYWTTGCVRSLVSDYRITEKPCRWIQHLHVAVS